MIDRLTLTIPFLDSVVIQTAEIHDKIHFSVDLSLIAAKGISLASRSLDYDPSTSSYAPTELHHPYESLASSYTGIAMKIIKGGVNLQPCVSLKASPAKILQGHNVFGSCDISAGALEMIASLVYCYPELSDILDISNTRVDSIDATFSARLNSTVDCKEVINQLRNVSNGQIRKSTRNEYETTVYFNENSRHCVRKVYLKEFEFDRQLAIYKEKARFKYIDFRVYEAMTNPIVVNFSKNLVRFEATAKDRFLEALGFPRNLFDLIEFQASEKAAGRCIIQKIWRRSFDKIFETFKGVDMNIHNDREVLSVIKGTFFKITKSGNISYSKADRIFRFYRSLMNEGYDAMKLSYSAPRTFYDNLNSLLECGFSKAHLQQLTGDKQNVTPLLRVINIDFANQLPVDFVEPRGLLYEHLEAGDWNALDELFKRRVA